MNREDRKKVTATKEECPEEQCKNIERRMVSGNSKEAKTPSRLSPRPNSQGQQSSKTAEKKSRRKAKLF